MEGLEEEEEAASADVPGREEQEVRLKDQEAAVPEDVPYMEVLEAQLEEQEAAAHGDAPGREELETPPKSGSQSDSVAITSKIVTHRASKS